MEGGASYQEREHWKRARCGGEIDHKNDIGYVELEMPLKM